MASSKQQLEANRANAKKSTGPRSQGGKARSRLNSRKHGLTAKTLVIGDEDPAQFDKLRAEVMEQYDPQSALERELVERLSSLLWRLRRIPAFEAAIIDARRAEVDDPIEVAGAERRGANRRGYERFEPWAMPLFRMERTTTYSASWHATRQLSCMRSRRPCKCSSSSK